MAESNEDRLRELGIRLPPVAPARGRYLPAKRSGDLLYLSGNGPIAEDGSMIRGVVGADVSVEEAQEAARLTAINILAVARAATGTLDVISGVVSVTGYVRAIPQFTDHPSVIDACSDLLADVFGDDGLHARAAVGVASLPFGIAVEVSAILSVDEAAQ